MSRRPTRRDFLQATGLSVMATPLLSYFQEARAAEGTYPTRFVVFHSPNGTVMNHFWPGDDSVTGSTILQPLTTLASKLVVLRGIDSESAYKVPVPPGHTPDNTNILTCRQVVRVGASWVMGGISIDQHVANVVGKGTKHKSIHVGVSPCPTLVSRGYNQPVPGEGDPARTATNLFGELTTAPDQLARSRARRKGVLDLVDRRIAALRSKIGVEDRMKLEGHLETLKEMKERIGLDVPATCKTPAPRAGSDLPTRGQNQMDLLVAALACDATRVATMSYGDFNTKHTFINYPNAGTPHHGISHSFGDADRRTVAEIDKFYASQFFYLLQRMDAVKEGDGTLLDHSVVVWIHEQADGASHSRRDHGVVLAGSGGGKIKTGRKLQLKGHPLSGLHISVANVVGVPTTSFGEPELVKGPLPGLV